MEGTFCLLGLSLKLKYYPKWGKLEETLLNQTFLDKV